LDKACDLPHRGRRKTYDTVLKINLMPKQMETNLRNSFTSKDVISVQSSRKVKNTLNPHFHEDFIFEVEKVDALKNLVLRLSLYDYERQGRFDAIGHIVLPLTCMTKAGESKKHSLPFKSQTTVCFAVLMNKILLI
jgi:Ca2+-dependent lipid-binding protein